MTGGPQARQENYIQGKGNMYNLPHIDNATRVNTGKRHRLNWEAVQHSSAQRGTEPLLQVPARFQSDADPAVPQHSLSIGSVRQAIN